MELLWVLPLRWRKQHWSDPSPCTENTWIYPEHPTNALLYDWYCIDNIDIVLIIVNTFHVEMRLLVLRNRSIISIPCIIIVHLGHKRLILKQLIDCDPKQNSSLQGQIPCQNQGQSITRCFPTKSLCWTTTLSESLSNANENFRLDQQHSRCQHLLMIEI